MTPKAITSILHWLCAHPVDMHADVQMLGLPWQRLADLHPFGRQHARLTHDHGLEQLLAGQLAEGRGRGVVADAPVACWMGIDYSLRPAAPPNPPAHCQPEDNEAGKLLIFNTFYSSPPLLSSRADNKVAGLSAALGLM